MDIFAHFATDEKKEIEGAWFDLPGDNGQILVARNTNEKYARAIVKAYERYKNAKGVEAEKRQEREYIRLLAEHILVDWKDIEWKGQPLPYSTQNAEMVLAIKDFRIFVQKCSEDFEAFRVEVEEEVGKSSPTSSDGS